MLTFNCPRCGAELFFEWITPGDQVKCMACGEITHAPDQPHLVEASPPEKAVGGLGTPESVYSPAQKTSLQTTRAILWLVGIFVAYVVAVFISWNNYLGGHGLSPGGGRIALTRDQGIVTSDFGSFFFQVGMFTGNKSLGERDYRSFDPSNPSPFVVGIFVFVAWLVVFLCVRAAGSSSTPTVPSHKPAESTPANKNSTTPT